MSDSGGPYGMSDPGMMSQEVDLVSPHAPSRDELERVLTAISDNYDIEDLGYAGDARIVNLRDQLTGSYVMTVTLTDTP